MSVRLYCLVILMVFLIKIEGKPQTTGKLTQRINHFLNITSFEKDYKNMLQTFIGTDTTFKNHKKETMLFFNK